LTTDYEDLPRLGVCTLTLNSGISINYVLNFLLMQEYPREKIFYLVVDGGSSDNTLEIVHEVFKNNPGLTYEVLVAAGTNIPQARNVCIERLLRTGVDYILFVDSDVVVATTNAFQLITQLAKEKNTLIHFTLSFRFFKNIEEFREFFNELQLNEINISSEDLIPSLHVGMGFTIIPRELATSQRFEEDVDFGEDFLYALRAYSEGYMPYVVRKTLPLYDVNVKGKPGDIYWKTSFKRYLRSARKKALKHLIGCVEDGSLKFSTRVFLRELVKHSVNAFLLATLYLAPMLALIDIKLFLAGILVRISSMIGYAVYKKLQGYGLIDGLRNRVKFELYSTLILLNLPLAYRDFRKLFHN
jgi:glycosyltransferase involved in cell wall biosynthesis